MPDRPTEDLAVLTEVQREVLATEAQYADDHQARTRARLETADRLFGPDGPCPARTRPMIRYLQVLIDLREHPAACEEQPLVMAGLRAEARRAALLRVSSSRRPAVR